jgi:Anti-sigma-K factor rskA
VEQVSPPPSLKASLMEVVEREARERHGATEGRRAPRRRRLPSFAGLRPALVAGALALGLLAGFGLAELADDAADTRTLTAESRIPPGSAQLQIAGDGEDGAILRVQGMPSLGGRRVYQAWVQRDGTVVPQPTFEVGEDGGGAVAVPDDLSGAEAVLVTREQRGGARAPSEAPILRVAL